MQDMTSLLRFLIVVVITGFAGQALAQGTSGAILGTVLDANGDPVINAQVQVFGGGIAKGGTVTDFDGNYVIKPLEPGRYDVRVNYIGQKESLTTGVLVQPGQNTEVNVKLQPSDASILEEVVITEYKVPLIDKYQGGSTTVKTSEEIEQMATRNTTSMVSTAAGAYSQTDGGAVSIAGARSEGTLYIIDGVQVYGSRGINVSQNAIDQIQVITSGLPANYGDAIGGVVNITTKGVSDKLRGSLLLEKSVDGYGHNLANFTLSGPLVKKRIDSVNKKPVVGFFLAGDVWYDKDRSPEYHGVYQLKDEKLEEIRQNPLIAVPNQSGVPVFRNRAETITANDLYITRQRPNADILEGRLTGRLDFQLADNLNLSAGGTFNYSRNKLYNRGWALLSRDEMPQDQNYTGRGFLRLTQRFRNNTQQPAVEGEEQQRQIITNAFYTLQVDYQTEYRQVEDPRHGDNIFNYGYVGKFFTEHMDFYGPGIDSVTGKYGTQLLVDHAAIQTTYERSDMNPLLANYTSQYFRELDGASPGDEQTIRARNALINGFMPESIYLNQFTTTGRGQAAYSQSGIQQYAVSVDASFDLQPRKTRHSIEFGLYYQQRNESYYQMNGASTVGTNIWQYMRQLTNTHIGLDMNNPYFIVDGKRYTAAELNASGISFSPFDTITYDRTIVGEQSNFDKNLRSKLGKSATEYIAIDELDPSTFSVDMFSADELLNVGSNPFVFYSGYDYKGNRQRGQVNFNDFFTKKDENGNYTRDIGAYRPNYIAGYVLDKFRFKDIFFNVGLRVERFDANTKVLKDPYSLYGVNSVSDARSITDDFGNPRVKNNFTDDGSTPGNIGDDYVVYVNNNESPTPSVIGYRNGDDWYDPYGRLIEDPTTLRQYSGGRDPQPYLVNPNTRITDSTFDPNSSFTDYKPQINVMPRVLFNFPISDNSMFYAHYDVVVQRPKSNVFTTPFDYYSLTANQGGTINNPDLKPEKMFDYEVGFKQKLSENSALTISGFYKERKDMIQVRPYLYAWPTTYFTYGNRDFSTTKGMLLRYDMRRIRNLRLDIAYTLQFANGTGSGTSSAVASTLNPSAPGLLSSFISAGLPNIRTVFPLDNDVRHNIVTTLDYRYGKGKGPVVANKHILENAGANFIFRTRSGEPYTRYTQPGRVANTVDGAVNGARLPWHYWIDLRVDKDFRLNFGKKDGDVTRTRRDVYVNVYVLVNNLLNTRDILFVDRYTGRPDDDGYLSHPQGIQTTNNQYNRQSFVDLYSANLIGLGGARVNLPRRINLGLNLNF